MDEIINLLNKRANDKSVVKPKKKVTKHIVKQKNEPEREFHPTSLGPISKTMSITAILRNSYTASFLRNIDECFFHSFLENKYAAHSCLLNLTDEPELLAEYKLPYSYTDFKFKLTSKTPYKDSEGIACFDSALIDKICRFTIKVIAYDFECSKTKKRRVGISIGVSQIVPLHK